MSDLIDRQNLMEQLNELCDKQCPFNEPTKAIGACCSSCAIDDVIEIVQNLPSAETVRYCKDCVRHNVSVQDWYDNHELKVCPLVEHRGKAQGHEFDYQFCVYADRKEDE